MTATLVVIDPQNDFCALNGSLYVPHADKDMAKLAELIQILGSKIHEIHVTLDTHHRLDISHPLWWQDKNGFNPKPFTLICYQEVKDKIWTAIDPMFQQASIDYLKTLELRGETHTIWPEHCLVGTSGHNIFPPLLRALQHWEEENGVCNIILKGLNPLTEHFSALSAVVPIEGDLSTELNKPLLKQLEKADRIIIAGEASTHCVLSTVSDLVKHLPASSIPKIIWLSDATSPVPDPLGTTLFSETLEQSLKDFKTKGMQIMSCQELITTIL